jgi:gamma-glutamyltranspeptidase / glutathione hydrolase
MVWSNAGETHRSTVMGRRGMVASAHPLASLAGLRMLMAGGNAIDAAVATMAALNVVEPYMSGLGGGGVMLLHLGNGETRMLDYSGHAPAAADASLLDEQTVDVGARSLTTPSALAGWMAALERYGTMRPVDVFGPAIEYAEQGVPLTVKNALFFHSADERVHGVARDTFFTNGAPAAATICPQPMLAATYRTLAHSGAEAFYHGEIGKRLVAAIQQAGGFLTEQDLANVDVRWADPSVSTYRGYELRTTSWPMTSYEMQLTLNILEGFDLAHSGHNSAESIHTIIEAMKLSIADRLVYAGSATPPPAGLLSAGYAAARRALIDPAQAQPIEGDRFTRPRPDHAVLPGNPGDFTRECTTHLDVIDRDGNAVSITQSIGAVFGSGFMAGDTGIMMNNFLYFLDLDPASPNVIRGNMPMLGPLTPTMLFRDDRLFLSIGTPGGFGITQTTVQMISNVVDHGFGVQAAIEAPRFKTIANTQLVIEDRVPRPVLDELRQLGHEVIPVDAWSASVGGGQGILIDPETGAYSGGADPRRDGYALGW